MGSVAGTTSSSGAGPGIADGLQYIKMEFKNQDHKGFERSKIIEKK